MFLRIPESGILRSSARAKYTQNFGENDSKVRKIYGIGINMENVILLGFILRTKAKHILK